LLTARLAASGAAVKLDSFVLLITFGAVGHAAAFKCPASSKPQVVTVHYDEWMEITK